MFEEDKIKPGHILATEWGTPVRVAEVLWRSDRDEVAVGDTDDGRWFLFEDRVELFATPHELAARLWPSGAGTWYADAVVDLGWYAPNWPKLDRVAEDMKQRRRDARRPAAAKPGPGTPARKAMHKPKGQAKPTAHV